MSVEPARTWNASFPKGNAGRGRERASNDDHDAAGSVAYRRAEAVLAVDEEPLGELEPLDIRMVVDLKVVNPHFQRSCPENLPRGLLIVEAACVRRIPPQYVLLDATYK